MASTTFQLLILVISFISSHSKDPSVFTNLGEIIGKTVTLPLEILPYKDVHQYLGIPFAKPPVGERRFLMPEATTNFSAPFNAKSFGAVCPQTPTSFDLASVNVSEDCLFLNIFQPNQTADKPTDGHAVMIWIHGGGFLEGTGNSYDGSFIAASGNVIVVTLNYRLNVFGFLITGDHNAPGNVGLWDQRLAFQWVHEHIARFGGDNKRVTIVGESAGGMSAIQHGLNPENQGLFQRIIAQSGSMSMPVQELERDVLKDARTMAESFGCKTEPTTEMMYCLRGKSVDDYIQAMKRLGFKVTFGPIIDGNLIEKNPKNIAKMAKTEHLEEVEFFRPLDLLSGFNAYEGVLFLPFVMKPEQDMEKMQPTRYDMTTFYIPSMLNYLYRKEFKSEIRNLIEAQYTYWKNPRDSNSTRLQIIKLLGDVSYGVPAVEMARLHKNFSTSGNFMYHFLPTPSHRWIPTPSWIPGATHSDELIFMFGGIGYIGVGEENAWELELITKMMRYWTNFIKSGNPNTPETITPVWPENSVDTGDYLKLEKVMSNSSQGQHLYAEEANFWLDVIPDLAKAVKEDDSNCSQVPVIINAAVKPDVLLILTTLPFLVMSL